MARYLALILACVHLGTAATLEIRGGNPQIPYGPPHWHAMGDSYSAGPGAGNAYDDKKYGDNKCFRGTGAYAPKIDARHIENIGNFQFLSCTGHLTKDMIEYQFPDLLFHEINSKMRVLLSIGGNDLMFSSYIKACLLGVPGSDCGKVVDEIENLLENKDGKNTLQQSLYSVWIQYYRNNRPRAPDQIAYVWQTGYPQFFQETDTRCNDQRIFLGKVWLGPKMTVELRHATNDLVRRANEKIQALAQSFANEGHWWFLGRWSYIDYSDAFNGHKLCEPFVTSGVGFSDPNVWFLGVAQSDTDDDDENPSVHGQMDDTLEYSQVDPNTCDEDAGDLGLNVACTLVRYKAANPSFDLNSVAAPRFLTKAFHPKSSGFNRVRDQILDSTFPSRGVALRVLPLGDSITNGFQSSDGNGYRKVFYDAAADEHDVDMIGTLRAGNMGDPDNEGHNGATIAQISGYADAALKQRPNVVLLHAGTNDMGSDADATGASDRLAALVDKILAQCPDAAVLVAKIIPSSDAARQKRIDVYNQAVEQLVTTRQNAGKHVRIMWMNRAVSTDVLFDSLHPNDVGYFQMGQHWYGGVRWADQQGWIKPPVAGQSGGSKPSACPSLPNWIPQGKIANGGGNGMGLRGTYACYADGCPQSNVSRSASDCDVSCHRNGGTCVDGHDGTWRCTGCDLIPAPSCTCAHTDGSVKSEPNPSGGACGKLANLGYNAVVMADIDGDGRDDYLWVGDKGEVIMYWNAGQQPDQGPNAGKVVWYPMGQIASGVGGVGRQVHLADLDGDGRADYIWVHDDGSASVWWNRGYDANRSNKVNWGSATGETVASGIGDGMGVRFADMNGDGKADFIHLAGNSAATLYLNQGRKTDGTWGWWNWGEVASGVGSSRDDIRFADLNGDGQADYLVVDRTSGRVDAWYNQGPTSKSWGTVSGLQWWNSTSQKNAPVATGVSYLDTWSDGLMVTFGDLNGDKRAEYLYVGKNDSSMYAFLNGC